MSDVKKLSKQSRLNSLNSLKTFIEKEIILLLFVFLLLLLSVVYPSKIGKYSGFVEWRTLTALTAVFITTTGVKESGYLYLLAVRILNRVETERELAIILILFSAFISTFLTNDVALLIVLPLTLGFTDLIENDISRLVVFEVLAVNTGSALTPVGNPQNLYLWHMWGVSFIQFVVYLLPLVFIMMVFLILLTFLSFDNRQLKVTTTSKQEERYKTKFILSIFMLIFSITFIELQLIAYLLPVLILIYTLCDRRAIAAVDWTLLVLFAIIFIDFHMISEIPAVNTFFDTTSLSTSSRVFLFSSMLSQLISNVPASIFISKFSSDWFSIAYGVNVGGNGLIFGSMANIIAIRIVKNRRKFLVCFHRYSMSFFFVTCGLTYILLKITNY